MSATTETKANSPTFQQRLGLFDATSLVMGTMIGSGIFVSTGRAANEIAGPALVVSYMIAGVTCLLAALCYAEFASMTCPFGSIRSTGWGSASRSESCERARRSPADRVAVSRIMRLSVKGACRKEF